MKFSQLSHFHTAWQFLISTEDQRLKYLRHQNLTIYKEQIIFRHSRQPNPSLLVWGAAVPVSVPSAAVVGKLAAHSRALVEVVSSAALPAQVVVFLTNLALVPGQCAEVVGESLGVLKEKWTGNS